MAEETDVRKRVFFPGEIVPVYADKTSFVVQHETGDHTVRVNDMMGPAAEPRDHQGTVDTCTEARCMCLYQEYQEYMEKHGPKLTIRSPETRTENFRELGRKLGEALQEFNRNMSEFGKGIADAKQQIAPDIGERVEQVDLDTELIEYQNLISNIKHAVCHTGPSTPARRLATIGTLIEAFEAGDGV